MVENSIHRFPRLNEEEVESLWISLAGPFPRSPGTLPARLANENGRPNRQAGIRPYLQALALLLIPCGKVFPGDLNPAITAVEIAGPYCSRNMEASCT